MTSHKKVENGTCGQEVRRKPLLNFLVHENAATEQTRLKKILSKRGFELDCMYAFVFLKVLVF